MTTLFVGHPVIVQRNGRPTPAKYLGPSRKPAGVRVEVDHFTEPPLTRRERLAEEMSQRRFERLSYLASEKASRSWRSLQRAQSKVITTQQRDELAVLTEAKTKKKFTPLDAHPQQFVVHEAQAAPCEFNRGDAVRVAWKRNFVDGVFLGLADGGRFRVEIREPISTVRGRYEHRRVVLLPAYQVEAPTKDYGEAPENAVREKAVCERKANFQNLLKQTDPQGRNGMALRQLIHKLKTNGYGSDQITCELFAAKRWRAKKGIGLVDLIIALNRSGIRPVYESILAGGIRHVDLWSAMEAYNKRAFPNRVAWEPRRVRFFADFQVDGLYDWYPANFHGNDLKSGYPGVEEVDSFDDLE